MHERGDYTQAAAWPVTARAFCYTCANVCAKVFHFSVLHFLSVLQLSTKLQELREKETLTNSLHRHLQTLSHTLSAANKLVNDRDDVIEVRGHIQQCKVCHIGIWDKNRAALLTDGPLVCVVSGDASAAVKRVRLG